VIKLADKININRSEKLFEAMLKVAAEEAVSEEMASLPSLQELENMPTPSDNFDKRIKKLIAKSERPLKRKRAMKTFMNVAASVCILFTVGAIVFISANSSNLFFLDNDAGGQIAPIAFDDLRIGFDLEFYDENIFLPDGFENTKIQYFDDMTSFVHVNIFGNQLVINQHKETTLRAVIDNDYREFSTTYISGRQIYFFESQANEEHVVIWEQDNTVIHAFSNIDIENLLLIVEHLISR